jgi:hypothetical protein
MFGPKNGSPTFSILKILQNKLFFWNTCQHINSRGKTADFRDRKRNGRVRHHHRILRVSAPGGSKHPSCNAASFLLLADQTYIRYSSLKMVRTTLISLFIFLMPMFISFKTFLIENSEFIFNFSLYVDLKVPLLLKILLYQVTWQPPISM